MDDRPPVIDKLVHRARTLPRSRQLALLGGVALVAAAAAFLVPYTIIQPYVVPRVQVLQPHKHGTIRLTDAQWANIKTGPVREIAFRTEHRTDGKIALDDDAVTPVFSPFSGRVTRLFAKPGDWVEEGTPLFAVQAFEFVQAQSDLVTAAATLATAQTRLQLAETAAQNQRQSDEAKGGALKDRQQIQVELAAARAGLRSASAALAAVRSRLRIFGKSDQEIAALEGEPTGKPIDPEVTVAAPVAGTITDRNLVVGQFIQSVGTARQPTPLFAIADLASLLLIANVRESIAPFMQKGQLLEVQVPAYPGRTFRAKVKYVAPSIDPASHRLKVQAKIENADGALKPEMFADFNIVTGGDEKAAAVPQDSVVYEGEYARVWVARGDNLLELRQVGTGRTKGDMVEVIGALKPGDTVVTNGAVFIDRAVSTIDDLALRE